MNGAGTGTKAYQAILQAQAQAQPLVLPAVFVAVLGSTIPVRHRLPSGSITNRNIASNTTASV